MDYENLLELLNDESNIDQVLNFLEKASESYYNTDELLLSDEEYDNLYYIIVNKYGERNKIKTGARPKNNSVEVEHTYGNLVGTLSKVNDIFEKDLTDDNRTSFEKWFTKNIKKLKERNIKLIQIGFTMKYDGNSIVNEYSNGKLVSSLTRGRDGKGMDLTHVFKDHTINCKEDIGIKYEVVITWENFKKLNEDFNTEYANPRSLVSGKLNDKNAYSFYKYFTLIPLWVDKKNSNITRYEELDIIEKEFPELFKIPNMMKMEYFELDINNDNDIDAFFKELINFRNTLTEYRSTLPVMIDGIVIDFADKETREILGENNDEPNWATALKLPYMSKSSVVTDFDYTLGKTGIITARVWFEPVIFNGSVYQKQSLQNYRRFNELKLSIGSKILVELRNDVLTYVTKIEDENETKEIEKFIDHCPVCNGDVEVTETGSFMMCINPNCEGKILGNVINFLEKMDIKNIKNATIQKIIDVGLIDKLTDIYTLDYDKLVEIEGIGSNTAMSIMSSILNKVPYDYEILGSLNIQNFSIRTSKSLCETYSLPELLEMRKNLTKGEFAVTISNLNGFSEILSVKLYDSLEYHKETIEFLLSRKHVIYKEHLEKTTNNSGEKFKIVFTDFRDEKLKYYLENLGHKIMSGVSSKVNYVVTPNPNGNTVKITKAKDLIAKGNPMKILTVQEFKELMNYTD